MTQTIFQYLHSSNQVNQMDTRYCLYSDSRYFKNNCWKFYRKLIRLRYFLMIYNQEFVQRILHESVRVNLHTLHKKWSFPVRISSVNVTQSATKLWIWSHFLKKSLIENFIFCTWYLFVNSDIKGTVMQIKKALINDRLHVSNVSWKFHIPTIYNFAVIYPWNLLFS